MVELLIPEATQHTGAARTFSSSHLGLWFRALVSGV